MDTKWKDYRYVWWLKLLAVALCLFGMLAVAYGSMKAPYFEYAVRSLESSGNFRDTAALQLNRDLGQLGIYQVIAGKLAFLIGVCYLIYGAGRRPDSDEVHLFWADRPYLDIESLFLVPGLGLGVAVVYQFWAVVYPVNPELFYVMSTTVIVVCTLLGILFGTSIVKRLKRKELLRHTLVGAVIRWKIGWLKRLAAALDNGLKKGPLAVRGAVHFGIFAGAVFLSVLATAVLASGLGFLGVIVGGLIYLGVHMAALLFVLKQVGVLQEITIGTERIRGGDLAYRMPKTGEPETDALIENINQIAEGLKASVENEVRAERLKAELVTNVSHDLKTPLTSIITYVDLLKTEGICSENAPQYLEVLDRKSQRLKSLTEDLFEAAKASSGSLAYSLEKLDVADLIAQGLGELTDRIRESGLDFKVNIPAEKQYVLGDGRLLWRVLENLLSNVFKYALPGSRVYIDTLRQQQRVLITVKNISAYELNIHADELMERFKRGDESRHSEGSGLGLSIARSLTELQGGTFGITIDGDLFKAEIALPGYPDTD